MHTRLACCFVLATLLLASWSPAADMPPSGAITLKGHTETVYAIAFTPDGKQVVTGSFDHTLKIWDATNGKELRTLGGQTGHQNLVLSLAISPDGQTLASGGADNQARLWDLPGSSALREMVNSAEVNAFALSPDGSRLATAGKDGVVTLWNTADGKQLLRTTGGHKGPATGIAFSANGQMIASSGADPAVCFWNAGNGQLMGTLEGNALSAAAVTFHPNNSVAYAAGEDGTLRFVQLPPAAPRLLTHPEAVTSAALSPDGGKLLTGSTDGQARLWNLTTSQVEQTLAVARSAVGGLAYSPDGKTAAVALADRSLWIWNTADPKEFKRSTTLSAAAQGLAFSPDGRTLAAGLADGTVRLFDLGQGKETRSLTGHAGPVTAVVFSPKGDEVLSAGKDKTIRRWSSADGSARGKLDAKDAVSCLAVNPDGKLAAGVARSVQVWNLADGKETLTLAHPAEVLALSFSADKTRLATGSADGVSSVWDLATGRIIQSYRQAGPLRSVAFHPNGTSVVTGGDDKTAAIYPVSVQRLVVASNGPIRALAVTPNGSNVLTGGNDKVVKAWNTSNGNLERTFAGPEGAVRAIAVSKNNALVAVSGDDQVVRVYQLADAKVVGTIKVPGPVRGLAFSANNATLAAACDSKDVAVWNVAYNPGQPVPAEFGKPVQSFRHAEAVTDVAFGPDNRTVYSGSLDKTVKTWKLAADAPTANFGHNNYVDAVAFNPAGTQLATGCHDGTVHTFDVAKKQQLKVINAHIAPPQPQQQRGPTPVYCVAWSADGKQVVSGSNDHSLKLWDAASGNLVREFKAYREKEFEKDQRDLRVGAAITAVMLSREKQVEKGHRDGVFCVAFSPDGKSLVSGSSDHTIKIWNIADGTVARELVNPKLPPATGGVPEAHPGWVYSLRFTPDGKHLVSVGNAPPYKGYIAIWNFADGKLLHAEELPLGTFNAVAVSPDGKLLGVACAPHSRQYQQVDSYLLKMPPLDKSEGTK